jgi:hypothetical protein
MKEVKFVPECATGKGASFKGHLVLLKPTVQDVLAGSKLAQGIKEGEELEAVQGFLDWSKPFYKSVELENSSDGTKYASFDDLMGDAECMEVLNEVALKLVTGLTKKKPMKAD